MASRSVRFLKAADIYDGSDGSATRQFLAALNKRGPVGEIAALLFKAQKASKRAKKYGPYAGINGIGSYRNLSYQRKADSLKELSSALLKYGGGSTCVDQWGWKKDPHHGFSPEWVLYVEIGCVAEGGKIGQVSFHSTERYEGPDYPGDWDHLKMSERRILEFCDRVMTFKEWEPSVLCTDCGEHHRKSESCELPFEKSDTSAALNGY
jgi:hypothetical protein